MRKTGMWLSVLAMVVCAGSAPALTTDGSWTDWFTYGGNVADTTWNENQVTLLNPNIRTQNDEEGPSPGGGGQDFDIEQIFYFYEDFGPAPNSGGILHIGLVTGFPSGGTQNLYAGDMFIDLGNTGGYDIAVAVGTENTVANLGGTRFGQAWANTNNPNWALEGVNTPFTNSNPYRVDQDAANLADNLGQDLAADGRGADTYTDAVIVAWGGQGVHNFLEISVVIDGSLENTLTGIGGGVGLHWTMLCGNDEIDVEDDDPFPPVPEPATMVLLGMGVLGIALRARRPQC